MKLKTLISTCLLMLFLSSLYAQELKPEALTHLIFYVKKIVDEKNIDRSYLLDKEENEVSFYYTPDKSTFCFANKFLTSNSQSFGPVNHYEFESDVIQTDEGEAIQSITFMWDYTNTYNLKSGHASISMRINDSMTSFYLVMYTEDGRQLTYAGNILPKR